MASFINDNGFDTKLNRGVFYGHRGPGNLIDGIALIGHSTLIEARSDDAVRAFAITARSSATPIHLVMSAGEGIDGFWRSFRGNAVPRLRCEELLFEASFPFPVRKCEWNVCPADMTQLVQIAEAQAEIAFAECGIDPMVRDRDGFLKRVARRIEQGRVFSVYQDGILIFKADIIAESDEVAYLEGIYVDPRHRGKGIGPACLSQLTVILLGRVSNVCMLSNVDFTGAHRSFARAGFVASDKWVTFFV
ncbi:MAG: GNAT family N-acetyltransferase [Acidobacteriota bacterium]